MSNSLSISTEAGQVRIDAAFSGLESIYSECDFAGLPQASRDHIIRVGLTNILRDSMAGKAGDPVEARQALVEKLQRVLSGDVTGATRGPRLNPEERTRNEYLDELVAKHCAAKGVALPKGKPAIAAAREKVYGKLKAKVDAEVKRRLRLDVDLGDLDL